MSDYPEDAEVSVSEFLFKIGQLCDFYNSAQILNKIYHEQKPAISSVPAINLAKKLNVLFKTDKFTVVLLKQGDRIYP